jgi:hypothetical protein
MISGGGYQVSAVRWSCYVDDDYIGDVIPVSVSCATFEFLLLPRALEPSKSHLLFNANTCAVEDRLRQCWHSIGSFIIIGRRILREPRATW